MRELDLFKHEFLNRVCCFCVLQEPALLFQLCVIVNNVKEIKLC
jgi:hypothetical protein